MPHAKKRRILDWLDMNALAKVVSDQWKQS